MLIDQGWHDNISHVLLGGSQSEAGKDKDSDDPNQSLVDALEQKYDVLKDKLIEAVSYSSWNAFDKLVQAITNPRDYFEIRNTLSIS